jgi:predicted Zn-dependent protease
MALARGLMLEMETEAQLAAVLGHEVGHVCARHTGARMSWAMMAQIGVVLLAAYLEEEHEDYAVIGAGLGMVGANMLLCRYSRDDERQADSLGLQYMTSVGYNPGGMSELMQVFMDLRKGKPNIVDVLFSTHPMSDERQGNANEEISSKYHSGDWKDGRERYMDNTASIRKIAPAIKSLQEGELAIMKGQFAKGEEHLKRALRAAPDDYAALMLMSKALYAGKRHAEAEKYALQARDVYPEEPQSRHLAGMVQLERKKYEKAFLSFDAYEKKLPGNPNTVYLKGVSLDGQGRMKDAADHYSRYLQESPSGEYAAKAKERLRVWGYRIPGEQT